MYHITPFNTDNQIVPIINNTSVSIYFYFILALIRLDTYLTVRCVEVRVIALPVNLISALKKHWSYYVTLDASAICLIV